MLASRRFSSSSVSASGNSHAAAGMPRAARASLRPAIRVGEQLVYSRVMFAWWVKHVRQQQVSRQGALSSAVKSRGAQRNCF